MKENQIGKLKLKGLKLGFVLNFGSNLMKDGIERIVNGLQEENLGVSNDFGANQVAQPTRLRRLRRMADLCG
jgi:hypothetical protein